MDCALIGHGADGLTVLGCANPVDPWWKIAATVVPPILLIFSLCVAGVSAWLAFRNILNARTIARQRATLDLIEKAESTEHYRKLASSFGKAEKAGKLGALNDPATEADKALRRDILQYFNHYELIAIGIKHAILDENVYREWMQSHVVSEWNSAQAFIQNERWRLNATGTGFEYKASLFGEMQKMVRRWSDEALQLDESYGAKPTLPAKIDAPGDRPLPDLEPPAGA